MIGETNKNVQIIVKRIRLLNSKEDIEETRKIIENHINNGWEIKASNMLDNKDYVYIYTLLVKE